MSAAAFPTLPAGDLEKAKIMAATAHGWLQEAYRIVRPHHTLAVQCETAGKAAARLVECCDARLTGKMP